jgi:hypothetical protein
MILLVHHLEDERTCKYCGSVIPVKHPYSFHHYYTRGFRIIENLKEYWCLPPYKTIETLVESIPNMKPFMCFDPIVYILEVME